MAERAFCIDFGSAYTKVALRRDPTADSELLTWPNVDFCVPSTVVVDRRGMKPRLTFGDEAADQRAGGGIDVFRNWKRSVFLTPTGARVTQSPLETLLESDELLQLATKFGVAHGQIAHLQQLVGAARSLVAGPGGRVISAESQQQTVAVALAAHFFHWLRQRVLEACAKLPTTGLKFEEIPVRVAVPAFAAGSDPVHPGCKLITEALGRAGWPLHPDQPVVAEPYSNAIGILTRGTNVISRSGRIHLGDMFGKGPLITVLKDPAHYPNYRALVIDIGAFTTDFAALSIAPDPDTSSDPNAGFQIAQRSLPLGTSDLDERVRQSLPQEKAEWLEKAKWQEIATFQRNTYTEGKGYRVAGVGVIGGDADRGAVQECLVEFCKRLAEEARRFCESLEPAAMQELILTGGGSNIPTVRDALQTASRVGGKEFAKTHAPDVKRAKPGAPLVDKLDEQFTRGGSALGGASIYFEKRYY
jgi:hypothetical protein